MLPCDGPAICKPERTSLEQALRILAVVTMVMTVPQVIAVWTQPNAGGFALVWIGLDAAIVAGLVLRH